MIEKPSSHFVQEKLQIIALCDEQLDVFFRPFGTRLLKVANACVGWPTPRRTVAFFKSLSRRGKSSAPLVEVLDYYAKNAGVDLVAIKTRRASTFEGEVDLDFACSAWRNLLQQELAISAEVLTSLHLQVDQWMRPKFTVHTDGLALLDLRQLHVVEAMLKTYWRDQLRWRRAHRAPSPKPATWHVKWNGKAVVHHNAKTS